MTKQHERVSTSSQSSRAMARDPQERYTDKPKHEKPIVREVVAVTTDNMRAVFHPPEFGEIRMVFQNGRLMQGYVTNTDNNVVFK